MIRHIVLLKYRPDVTEEAATSIFAELHQIEGKVPGLLGIHSGRSESPEKIERGYMHGFTADFESWEALQAYQDHPDHQKVGARMVAHAEGGKDGILVLDIEA